MFTLLTLTTCSTESPSSRVEIVFFTGSGAPLESVITTVPAFLQVDKAGQTDTVGKDGVSSHLTTTYKAQLQ